MDEELLSETLEAKSDRQTARATGRGIKTLKGIRGTPMGELARIGVAAWKKGINLDRDDSGLRRLFGAAWEDGLLAVGLTAAALPDDPEAAWELGREWADRVDDLVTADAIGWLLLGPALLAMGRPIDEILQLSSAEHTATRRAGIASALAFTTLPIEGPAAAPLRERVGQKKLAFVEHPLSDGLAALCSAYLRDPAPEVRKVIRRVLRIWAKEHPEGVVAWADTVRGGLPKILSDEVKRARRRVPKEEE